MKNETARDLFKALKIAREKHPVAAIGKRPFLFAIGEEVFELTKAIICREGDERIRAEAMDCVVVLIRFIQGE